MTEGVMMVGNGQHDDGEGVVLLGILLVSIVECSCEVKFVIVC